MSSSASAISADTPALPFSRRDSVPRSQPSRRLGDVPALVVHALADQFARMRRVQHRANALACNVVHGQHSLQSVAIDHAHAHGLTVLEAEHHAPISGDADAPLTRTVAVQGVQPKSRCGGSCCFSAECIEALIAPRFERPRSQTATPFDTLVSHPAMTARCCVTGEMQVI